MDRRRFRPVCGGHCVGLGLRDPGLHLGKLRGLDARKCLHSVDAPAHQQLKLVAVGHRIPFEAPELTAVQPVGGQDIPREVHPQHVPGPLQVHHVLYFPQGHIQLDRPPRVQVRGDLQPSVQVVRLISELPVPYFHPHTPVLQLDHQA